MALIRGKSGDNLNEFMFEYLKHARDISKIVAERMGQVPKDITEEEFDVQVCWQVTDNIRFLLAFDPDANIIIQDATDVKHSLSTIRDALLMNQLVTIKYEGAIEDETGFRAPEHYVSCVGSNGQVHLIQFQAEEDCTGVESMSIQAFLKKLYFVMMGREPDWFNKVQTLYRVTVEVYKRKLLNRKAVQDFLQRNQHFLAIMNFRIQSNI